MPPITTTSLKAAEVMDRSASLLNDTSKTDYTYVAQLPYLNMAIDELQETLEEHNMSPTNQTAAYFVVPVGTNKVTPTEHPDSPHYPFDLIEIRALNERLNGTSDAFILMNRKDDLNVRPATESLISWYWEDQFIKFNELGATSDRQIKLDYVKQPLQLAQNEDTFIGLIGARSYLSFKTAAFCAEFIGENQTRADSLNTKADEAIDRLLGIGSKGRQAIVTRRRPFRSSYKSRGWI